MLYVKLFIDVVHHCFRLHDTAAVTCRGVLMKIICQQGRLSGALLDHLGIQTCYFKHSFTERDTKGITNKLYYHTGYEIHIVEEPLDI